jgi:hypothetical protein
VDAAGEFLVDLEDLADDAVLPVRGVGAGGDELLPSQAGRERTLGILGAWLRAIRPSCRDAIR